MRQYHIKPIFIITLFCLLSCEQLPVDKDGFTPGDDDDDDPFYDNFPEITYPSEMDQGEIHIWGDATGKSSLFESVPQGNDFVMVDAGINHAVALRADGSVEFWGDYDWLDHDHDKICDKDEPHEPETDDYKFIEISTDMGVREDKSIVLWEDWDGSYVSDRSKWQSGYYIVDGRLAIEWSDDPGWISMKHAKWEMYDGYYDVDNVAVSEGTYGEHAIAIRQGAENQFSVFGFCSESFYQQSSLLCSWNSRPLMAVSAGGEHQVILKEDGSITALGDNTYGQTDVPNNKGWKQISAGATHTVVMSQEGTLFAWGANNKDEVTDHPTDSGYKAISAGENYTLAIK